MNPNPWLPNAPPLYPMPQPSAKSVQMPVPLQQLDMQHLQQPPLSENVGGVYMMQSPGAAYQLQAPKDEGDGHPRANDGSNETAGKNVILMPKSATMPLGHESQRMTCPHCHVKMFTKLNYRSTYRTHLFAVLFCITGLICLVPLPYCMKSCRSLDHYCSSCEQFVGISPA